MDAGLNSLIIKLNSQVTPMEELEFFPLDPRDLTKMLQVRNGLNLKDKQKVKSFLLEYVDIFTKRHTDIDPKISCHHSILTLNSLLTGKRRGTLTRKDMELWRKKCKSRIQWVHQRGYLSVVDI